MSTFFLAQDSLESGFFQRVLAMGKLAYLVGKGRSRQHSGKQKRDQKHVTSICMKCTSWFLSGDAEVKDGGFSGFSGYILAESLAHWGVPLMIPGEVCLRPDINDLSAGRLFARSSKDWLFEYADRSRPPRAETFSTDIHIHLQVPSH